MVDSTFSCRLSVFCLRLCFVLHLIVPRSCLRVVGEIIQNRAEKEVELPTLGSCTAEIVFSIMQTRNKRHSLESDSNDGLKIGGKSNMKDGQV